MNIFKFFFVSFCLPTTVSLSDIFKESSELGVSARITSLGTYAAKITAAVVNDNTVLFFHFNSLHIYLTSNR